jgi:asparagine N-glycosylation enzyme membrane subunit Stt3
MTTEPRRATESAGEPQHENAFVTKKLRLAGMFILAGAVIQGISLLWNHPLSFLAFLGIGALASFVGIVVYLAALVSPRQSA